jgi:hypothetical protein
VRGRPPTSSVIPNIIGQINKKNLTCLTCSAEIMKNEIPGRFSGTVEREPSTIENNDNVDDALKFPSPK